MIDLIVRNCRLVDGTGEPSRDADVGVSEGRIVAIGTLREPAGRTIDAGGKVLAPGFIDMHTHYDAQAFWDPTMSPSCYHGVTTAIAGNCGFSIAPLSREAAPYLLRMLARVEGMPETSLREGVPWDWESFGDYLARLEGRVGINMGFMCGHSALRRVVMGPRSTQECATDDDLERMKALLAQSLGAGAMGFSSTTSPTHNDAEGIPVPSRHASREEIVELSRVCRDYPGTLLEFIPGIGMFTDEHIQLMTDMSLAAGRSLNWNVVVAGPGNEAVVERQLSASDSAREAGAHVVALAMTPAPAIRLNFRSGFVFDNFPGWDELFRLPIDRRMELLSDRERRAELIAAAESDNPFRNMSAWGAYTIASSANKAIEGKQVAEIAEREGKSPADAMIDIAIADELNTVFRPPSPPETAELKRRRLQLWRDSRVLPGASDAGAHLDMIDAFASTTSLLAATRDHSDFSVEEAVMMLTKAPAEMLGLRDRGIIAEGNHADLVIFDPDTVAPGPTEVRHDLPGGEMRLYADAIGIDTVVANGVVIVEQGRHTGELAGRILRSGLDTGA
jgi:N-acyl-D-aspartate/D-glutamate deacylase